MNLSLPIVIIISAVCAIVFCIIGIFAGIAYRKKIAEGLIDNAEKEAARLVNEAIRTAQSKKKEALIEAKEEIHKNRTEVESELKERRIEVQRQERRIQQKEENLDKKTENLEKKEAALTARLEKVEKTEQEVIKTKEEQIKKLEEIAGYTAIQAKEHLLSTLEVEIRHEKAQLVKNLEQEYKEDSDEKARKIISLAIQKCAADTVAEVTVSVVPLPNDEMKGRIIGREGRNIRALESITGVDLIIDDTPEAITISSHEPIRREVARLTLEKLISDGRIHPTRIEELYEKSKREVDSIIKQQGERATFETGIHGIHPDVIKLLGRLHFRTSFAQNVLNHSIEVAHIAGAIAAELGVDVTTAKRAGLLHDIGKSVDHEIEGSHIQIGVDIVRKYKENEDIIHAVEAHHGDVEAKTVIASIIQAADAISAARPGARRENVENYIKRLQKLEEIACDFEGVEKTYAIQAGREIRIVVKPDIISDDDMILLSHDIVKRIEEELDYPGQIKVHVIRESRAIDFAK